MPAKLLIVNNGLKDLRGHYFETAVSVAAAARDLGYRPILAAHVTCPSDIIPGWLEFLPVCRGDHWMGGDTPPAADLRTLRPSYVRMQQACPDTLTEGHCSFTDYLGARFHEAAFVPPTWPTWMGPADHAADPLFVDLGRIESDFEYRRMLIYLEDLDRLLALAGVGPDDHVFLPTAHGREFIAIQRITAEVPAARLPTFHLEFRHAMDMPLPNAVPPCEHPYVTYHRVFFDHARRVRPHPKVLLYTDTDGLTEEYEEFSGFDFGTLPIPFRAELIPVRRWQPGDPINVAYFGDVRDEKGFHLMPAAVDAVRDDLDAGVVRFLIQATLIAPEHNPASAKALAWLKAQNHPHIRLVAENGPMSPDEYYRMVSEVDLLCCPYDPVAYKRRSSGTLTEAIATGVPTVVPAGTWLAKQQPAGGGELFADEPSFAAAVRAVCGKYPEYLAAARRHQKAWLGRHTPANLVRALVDSAPAAPARARAA